MTSGLCMYPSYMTPFWMHRRGSQLTSVPISQAFMGTEHFPLLKNWTKSLKEGCHEACRKNLEAFVDYFLYSKHKQNGTISPFFFCSNTLLIHKPCMYLSVEVNVHGKAHSANLQHCLHSPPTNHPSALQTPLALGHPRKWTQPPPAIVTDTYKKPTKHT